jgi:hypothetical protein
MYGFEVFVGIDRKVEGAGGPTGAERGAVKSADAGAGAAPPADFRREDSFPIFRGTFGTAFMPYGAIYACRRAN